jgi:hypothetical protein
MNFPVTIPVFIHDDITMNAEDAGVQIPLESCDTADALFYHIDHILTYPLEGDGQYTCIFSGQGMCISPMSMAEIQKRIQP